MAYIETTATKKLKRMNKRIRIVQGGTSASKTISILLILIDIAASIPNLTITIVSESLPHLKKGAMKDFFSILKAHGYYRDSQHNKTDNVYTFRNGTYFEFFGADDPEKARGPRRDILFINECNNVPYMVFDQMEVRTKMLIFLDYNPTSEFWVNTEVMPTFDYDFIKLTYLDNEALDPSIRASIESRRKNANWWKIFGEGEMGIKEGQIYQDWKPIKSMPEEARLIRRGLDFGYTNDPSGLISLYKWNDAYIVKEELYRLGMKNEHIANAILDLNEPKMLVIADSAEPKSIDEIKSRGVSITGAVKGADSVNYGIDVVQAQDIYYTEDSLNLIEEKNNYLWKIDKRTNKPLNEPEDQFNHLLDPTRYALVDVIGIAASGKYNLNRIG